MKLRKFYSILFLVIFTSYNLGHLLYIHIGPIQITKQWYQKVIYADDPRLTTITIPINMPPYAMDQEDYQYSDGSVILDGNLYRKVFQRVARDTLFVKVLPDYLSHNFKKSLTEWIHSVNDTNEKNTPLSSEKESTPPPIKEYVVCELYSFISLHQVLRMNKVTDLIMPESNHPKVPTPPPKA